MTLNITIVGTRCIYQSADYRLMDWNTGRFSDFDTQKIVPVSRFGWSATVCFAGVGRTRSLDVGEWLVERIAAVQQHDPFDRLLDELLTADAWLSNIPSPQNKHSFSVGAFIDDRPIFALVSNFEGIFSHPAPVATRRLSISTFSPRTSKTFLAGQRRSVSRPQQRRLAAMAEADAPTEAMFAALADVTRSVAERNDKVSRACFTTSLRPTGEGGGAIHDLGNRPFMPRIMPVFPGEMQQAVTKLLDEQFGLGKAQLRSMSFARSEPREEFHQIQLREKPNDSNVWNNYGAFLRDVKGDSVGAEQAYRRALELNGSHVHALGNLANVLWERRDLDGAADLYQRAMRVSPQDENVTFNYARFLNIEVGNRAAAHAVLRGGIKAHPNSGRLLLLQGQLLLQDGNGQEALLSFAAAREKDANLADVESGYAVALHVSGGPSAACIPAYRVAIALNPENAGLRLNLAQVLFLHGNKADATRNLQAAMQLGLDDSEQLEAEFYRLAHLDADVLEVLSMVRSLLSRGARLRWNVSPTIEVACRAEAQQAAVLFRICEVMAGTQSSHLLDELFAQWAAFNRS
jgi:Flp pilus assembly protein TadD